MNNKLPNLPHQPKSQILFREKSPPKDFILKTLGISITSLAFKSQDNIIEKFCEWWNERILMHSTQVTNNIRYSDRSVELELIW